MPVDLTKHGSYEITFHHPGPGYDVIKLTLNELIELVRQDIAAPELRHEITEWKVKDEF